MYTSVSERLKGVIFCTFTEDSHKQWLAVYRSIIAGAP